MSKSIIQAKSHERNLQQGMKNSARSIESLDTAVLLDGTGWNPKPQMACESWRSEATVDTGLLLRDPETFGSGGYGRTKLRYAGAADFFLEEEANANVAFLHGSSSVMPESGRILLPKDRDYFQTPASSYHSPVFGQAGDICGTGKLNIGELDPQILMQRSSRTASEMDNSVDSSGSTTFRDLSPRTNASLDTKILLRDPDEDFDYKMQTSHYRFASDQQVFNVGSELEEDSLMVDPLDDLVSARTVASLTTEVLLKPTEELTQALDNHKVRKAGKQLEETCKVTSNIRETPNQAKFELPNTHGVIIAAKHVHSDDEINSEISSTVSDKPAASKHPKAKPPTPKSFFKSPNMPNSQPSLQRCFCDLDGAELDETSSETGSTLVYNGKDTNGRETSNLAEHTRMHRAFAQSRSCRDTRDVISTSPSDNLPQITKLSQVQRSRSASRSRSGIVNTSSVLDSPRSVETGVSLGQKIVRKSQENRKKMWQKTIGESSAFSQSLMHDNISSSGYSQKSTLAHHDHTANGSVKKYKRSHTLGRVQEGTLDAALELTVKGSPVQSRPLSSSSSMHEVTANEWIRRKKYNPRQSLKAEALLKKTGQTEQKPVERSGSVKKTKSEEQYRKICADSSAKNAPSTSSDVTDDEEELTPHASDLSAVCRLSAKVKLLSDRVLQALRRRPEFMGNDILQRPKQTSTEIDSLENPPPEFRYILHNLEAAEQQMSTAFKALSFQN